MGGDSHDDPPLSSEISMKYQYVGDDDHPPKITVFYGYKFTLNHKYVNVTDEKALAKLKNHRCFKLFVEKKKNGK